MTAQIHPDTLHSRKLSQCRVGVQSLGKVTRSLGANLVAPETGARRVETCEHNTGTLPLPHRLPIILSIFIFYLSFYALYLYLIIKSYA